jgi:hypothetical protein
MGKEEIAITLDEEFIDELDRLVDEHVRDKIKNRA